MQMNYEIKNLHSTYFIRDFNFIPYPSYFMLFLICFNGYLWIFFRIYVEEDDGVELEQEDGWRWEKIR